MQAKHPRKMQNMPTAKKPMHYPTRCAMSVVDNMRYMARWYWLQSEHDEEHY
jgi:hypothetical protein